MRQRAATAALFALFAAPAAAQATWVVDAAGGGQFLRIADAFDAATYLGKVREQAATIGGELRG